jgi:hypothetical protein
MKPTWTEERAELAIWLRSYTETIARWIKKFLEDPEHPVSKTKMLGQLDEWITRLEGYRNTVMLLRSDPPEEKTIRGDEQSDQTAQYEDHQIQSELKQIQSQQGGTPTEQTEQTEESQ